MAQVQLYLSLYAVFPGELSGFFKPENACEQKAPEGQPDGFCLVRGKMCCWQ